MPGNHLFLSTGDIRPSSPIMSKVFRTQKVVTRSELSKSSFRRLWTYRRGNISQREHTAEGIYRKGNIPQREHTAEGRYLMRRRLRKDWLYRCLKGCPEGLVQLYHHATILMINVIISQREHFAEGRFRRGFFSRRGRFAERISQKKDTLWDVFFKVFCHLIVRRTFEELPTWWAHTKGASSREKKGAVYQNAWVVSSSEVIRTRRNTGRLSLISSYWRLWTFEELRTNSGLDVLWMSSLRNFLPLIARRLGRSTSSYRRGDILQRQHTKGISPREKQGVVYRIAFLISSSGVVRTRRNTEQVSLISSFRRLWTSQKHIAEGTFRSENMSQVEHTRVRRDVVCQIAFLISSSGVIRTRRNTNQVGNCLFHHLDDFGHIAEGTYRKGTYRRENIAAKTCLR
jgi:hypothetical protein